jgi:hypothetical protein
MPTINPQMKLLVARAYVLRRAAKEAEKGALGGFAALLTNPAYESLATDALTVWDEIVRPSSVPPTNNR